MLDGWLMILLIWFFRGKFANIESTSIPESIRDIWVFYDILGIEKIWDWNIDKSLMINIYADKYLQNLKL